MATFISTVNFTDQGLKAISETTQRAAKLKRSAKKVGIEVTSIYWTMGAFDGVLIFDAPNEETAVAWLLNLGAVGNLRTRTSRAFNAAEMEDVLAKLGSGAK
jgi:uncharacterized protein with GYD domain